MSEVVGFGNQIFITVSGAKGDTGAQGERGPESRSGNYIEKTSKYDMVSTDFMVNCTSNSFLVKLPTSISLQGYYYNIKNSGNGIITVVTSNSQTIENETQIKLYTGENITVISDGANWLVI